MTGAERKFPCLFFVWFVFFYPLCPFFLLIVLDAGLCGVVFFCQPAVVAESGGGGLRFDEMRAFCAESAWLKISVAGMPATD